MGWEYVYVAFVIISVLASVAAAFLLKPKGPPPPAPATLDEIQLPVAEEGKEVGVLFGTCDLTEQDVVWHGNLYPDPIYLQGGGKK